MKKFYFLLISSVIVVAAIISCNKSYDNAKPKAEKLRFESFEKYGKIHNDFLTNVKDNFNPDKNINTLKDGINYIDNFQQKFLKSLDISDNDKSLLSKSLTDNKELVVYEKTYNKLFPSGKSLKNSDSEDTSLALFDIIEKVKDQGVIDDFEYKSLSELGMKVKQSYEGLISDPELKSFVIQLKEEWISKGYTVESENGRVVAYVLAISLASLEWWENNQEGGLKSSSILKRTKALPAWAAADIGGAIVGGAWRALSSYQRSGKVDWGGVGRSALGGGIATSTGAAGKVGKWISKLF